MGFDQERTGPSGLQPGAGGGVAYLGRRTPTPATPFDPAATADRLERLLLMLRQLLREGASS